MAKNVLIFFPYPLKENLGGPFSYLYQLKNAFAYDDVNLVFLSDLLPFSDQTNPLPPPSKFRKLLKRFVLEKAIYSHRIYTYLNRIRQIPFVDDLKKIDLDTFDAVHFHETIASWRFKDLLKDYRGKIIFTPHAPKPFFLEILEDVYGVKESQVWRMMLKKLRALDETAFSAADIIVSPCREALDAYAIRWPAYKKIVSHKPFYHIPTGITQPVVSRTAKEIREKLSVPDSAFVVCFNGRHKEVKGYDLLVQAARQLLHEYKDLYFLVTGKAEASPTMAHERWIETGWTNEPQNFVNATDVVAVPNRETFFDLNVLMALALGKPLILSNTGGNKYFQTFDSTGIFYFEIEKENAFAEAIRSAYKNKKLLPAMGKENKEIFLQNFTLSHFAEGYRRFYLSV